MTCCRLFALAVFAAGFSAVAAFANTAAVPAAQAPFNPVNTVEVRLVNVNNAGIASATIAIPGRAMSWQFPNVGMLGCSMVAASRQTYAVENDPVSAERLLGYARSLVSQELSRLPAADQEQIAQSFAHATRPVIVAAEQECVRKKLIK